MTLCMVVGGPHQHCCISCPLWPVLRRPTQVCCIVHLPWPWWWASLALVIVFCALVVWISFGWARYSVKQFFWWFCQVGSSTVTWWVVYLKVGLSCHLLNLTFYCHSFFLLFGIRRFLCSSCVWWTYTCLQSFTFGRSFFNQCIASIMSASGLPVHLGLHISSFVLWTAYKLSHYCSTSVDSMPHCLMRWSRCNAPSNSALYDVVDDMFSIRKHAVMCFWSPSCITHVADPIFFLYCKPTHRYLLQLAVCAVQGYPCRSILVFFSLFDASTLALRGGLAHTPFPILLWQMRWQSSGSWCTVSPVEYPGVPFDFRIFRFLSLCCRYKWVCSCNSQTRFSLYIEPFSKFTFQFKAVVSWFVLWCFRWEGLSRVYGE